MPQTLVLASNQLCRFLIKNAAYFIAIGKSAPYVPTSGITTSANAVVGYSIAESKDGTLILDLLLTTGTLVSWRSADGLLWIAN